MYYSLADTKSFDPNGDQYVTHLALNCIKSQLAVNLSNEMIEILDSKTLQTVSDIKTLDSLNPVLKYSPENSNQLFVSTSDSIKVFDLRHKSPKIVKQFRVLDENQLISSNDLNYNQFLCFDFNCDNTYICAGTESSEKDKNSYVVFWDIRKPALVLGTYYESHTNDVTDICFDPKRRHIFATGSSDELINVFDLNETEEEEAILATLNVESAVDRIYWTSSLDNGLVCLTQDESIQLWDTEDVAPKFSRSGRTSTSDFEYVIDFLANMDSVVVGDKNNWIKTFDINKTEGSEEIHYNMCLSDGHNKMVRTVTTDSEHSILYSGAEDGMVCVWNQLESTDSIVQKSQSKGKTKMRNKEKNRSNPY